MTRYVFAATMLILVGLAAVLALAMGDHGAVLAGGLEWGDGPGR